MKNKKTITLFTAVMAFMLLAFSFESNAQNVKKRLPDGTIIYTDGSVKKPTGEVINPNKEGTRLPDGTIIYPNGKTYPGTTSRTFPSRGVRQADGSILYPDGRIKYPDGSVRYPDGRIVFDCPKQAGTYRLIFAIEDYYQNEEHFFMNTPIVFQVKNTERKYHVPLLLNPYGYSTYRGT